MNIGPSSRAHAAPRLRTVAVGLLTLLLTAVAPAATALAAGPLATVTAGTAVRLSVTAPATATAGTPVAVKVVARDAAGQVATSYRGTVAFRSTDTKAVLPAAYTFTTADNGVHTFTGVALRTAGTRTVTVADRTTTTLTGTTSSIAVTAAKATRLTVTASATATAGAPTTVTVTAKDAFFNVDRAYRGTVALTSDDPAARTLVAGYAFTSADAGAHRFTVALPTAGTRSVVAKDVARTTVTGSAAVTVAGVTAQATSTLWTWGSNTAGQLGDGTTTDRVDPARVGTRADWATVEGGTDYSVAIKQDGSLWAWGSNNGRLGDGTTTSRATPVRIGTDRWKAVSAGEAHTLGIKADGTLWAWGQNWSGQVGDGTTTKRTAPVRISADTTWTSVAAGNHHSAAVRSDGTLWTWGANFSGQLGEPLVITLPDDGTSGRFRTTPKRIGTATTWRSVSAHFDHTLALRSDGTLWSWGANERGALGVGTTTNGFAPAQVGTDRWTAVTAGVSRSFGIKADGSLWAWGENSYGALGDGTTTDQLVPVRIAGAQRWAQVASGSFGAVAVASDGSLWQWGENWSDPARHGKPPARVGTGTGWALAGAGSYHFLATRH